MLGRGPLASVALASIRGGSTSARLTYFGSNVLPSTIQVLSGHLLYGGATPTPVFAPARVTWTGIEALHSGAAAWRTSFIAIEILRSTATQPTYNVVSWMGLEIIHSGAAAWRTSWIGIEILHSGAAAWRTSWIGMEVLRSVKDRPPDDGWISLLCG